MTDDYQYLRDDCKRMLPADYTMMAANRIKLFANYDKMRILEYLTLNGPQSVSGIIDGIGCEQIKVSQYLKRLRDDGFVTACRQGRFIITASPKACTKPASNVSANATIRLPTNRCSDFFSGRRRTGPQPPRTCFSRAAASSSAVCEEAESARAFNITKS